MILSSLVFDLAAACVATLSLFAGTSWADDAVDGMTLPTAELPVELEALVAEGYGSVWLVDAAGNRSEKLGSWVYHECDHTISVNPSDDVCRIWIDLKLNVAQHGVHASSYVFQWTKTDPSLTGNHVSEASVVSRGEIGFLASDSHLEPALLISPEIDAVLYTPDIEGRTKIRFVGFEP